MYISAQIFIVVSSVLYGLSCLAKDKKILFVVQIFSSLFYGLHCFFMGAVVGGIVTIFDILRVVIFYILEKVGGTQKQKIFSASILFVIAIICSACSWEGWFSALPLAGALIFIVALAISRLLLIKCATLISGMCSATYLFLSNSRFGALVELIPVVLALVGIGISVAKMVKEKRKNT